MLWLIKLSIFFTELQIKYTLYRLKSLRGPHRESFRKCTLWRSRNRNYTPTGKDRINCQQIRELLKTISEILTIFKNLYIPSSTLMLNIFNVNANQ